MGKNHTEQDDQMRTVLTLNTCAAIPGAEVRSFKTEKELLIEFQKLIQIIDPDFLTIVTNS